MSNFVCPHCGMTNINCGKEGFKTLKEIKYEKALEEIEGKINNISDYLKIGCDMDRCEDCNHFKPYCTNQCVCYLIQQGCAIRDIISKAKGEENAKTN